ncbi:MAG: hypothetical protein IPH16_04660 [Haliscomenobacter sp.]|nr:hypothetical protein [Haliscomenobacter sp.]MBK7474967.1 hypothetical protein [Haliscomenobacter sp.]MBK8880417.1 hypothetical protein [Haliscomenobacter sp.]
MTHQQLMTLISQGEIEKTISVLLDFVGSHYARFATDIYLISGRFNQVEKERRQNTIPSGDYRIEINSIQKSLMDIIVSMEGLNEGSFKRKKNDVEILAQIKELENRFDLCRKKAKAIEKNPTRLREKNEISRELSQIFIDHPEMIQKFFGANSEGVISGIANRYKRLPELSGIDYFESISKIDLGNFTKCCIVNALAEILYSGQLRTGDDGRISKILDELFPNSYQTVRLSITRVSAELDYFSGNI